MSSDLDGSHGEAPLELAGDRHEGAAFSCSVQSGQSVQFELVKGPPTITRVFELTGLTSSLPFRDSPP